MFAEPQNYQLSYLSYVRPNKLNHVNQQMADYQNVSGFCDIQIGY